MARSRKITFKQFDWLTLVLYLLLVAAGLLTLYTIDTASGPSKPPTDFARKQGIWFITGFVFFVIIYLSDIKKIREWSSLFYLGGLLLLGGLFLFGKEISGAKAWYRIGSFGFQPAEYMKLATALGLAKLLSERGFELDKKINILKSLLLIGIPAALILLQPDLGTVLVFMAFIVVLYREGLSGYYISPVVWMTLLFLLTVIYGHIPVMLVLVSVFIAGLIVIYFKAKKHRWNYIVILSVFTLLSIGAVRLTSFVYNDLLKPHQQKRIALLLGKISDDKGVGYHLKQSLIAISNGGLKGQGFRKGVQLQGNYIPEQHTDYIFTALAEQFGLTGSLLFLGIYLFFIVRLFILAERQKQRFSRVFGYSLASLLSVHLFINILMVIGLFPVIGIPIVFVSYGGSSLFFFSIFLFLFLKFDANRVEEF